jgi:hypothetical protein
MFITAFLMEELNIFSERGLVALPVAGLFPIFSGSIHP